jgi:galactokinase
VALVKDSDAAAFEINVAKAYEAATRLKPAVYVTEATGGACRLDT